MRDTKEPRSVDMESYAYYPDQVRKRLHWEFASDQDVRNFFTAMLTKSCVPVEPGSERQTEDEGFLCEQYEVLGLTITKSYGLGTMVCIQNKAARDA